MKVKVAVIGLLVVLVAVVAGCGGSHRYDSRLVLADSLMHANPDSALALVEAVSPDSLSTEGDHAYRDLLLTQARYKCYITATSDSAINRALAYYRHHKGEGEKLTRAYIYKGAVMQELGHPDSAMYYYKTAEATADPDDYANLGQINTRIADMYRLYYADKQICYDKYKRALKYYKLTNNKPLQYDCYFHMGGCSAITNNDDSKKLLSQACQIALELNDSLKIFKCQELRCRQLSVDDSTLDEAKIIALDCLNNYRRYINNDLLLDLASIYVNCGNPDSANYYITFVDENSSLRIIGQVRYRKYLILSKIAKLEGNIVKSNNYQELSQSVSDSIMNDPDKYCIQQIEDQTNKQKNNDRNKQIDSLEWIGMFLTIALIVLLLLLFISNYRNKRYIKSILQGIEETKVGNHEPLLAQIKAQGSTIERFVINLVAFMQTIIETSEKDSPTVIRKRIKQSIRSITNDAFWNELRGYIDKNYNNIITEISENPKISEKDLRLIELSLCGFDYVEIAITLGYRPEYISQKRREIAKKLNLGVSLNDYLEEIKL
jgi:hypothetical protein